MVGLFHLSDMTTLDDRHQMVRQVESSLKRLQTGQSIGLYQTHWPDHGMGAWPERKLSALTDLKKAGKIRLAGTSNETSCVGSHEGDFGPRSSPSDRMEQF